MWRNVGIAVLTLVLGYVSNGLSQTASLENAVFWYSRVLMFGQPFYVKLDPGQENIRQALDNVQAPYTVITPTTENMAYPQVSIRTNAWVPFLISEQFTGAGDASNRAIFSAHYIAFFGMALSVGDSVDIPMSPQPPLSTASQTGDSQNTQ